MRKPCLDCGAITETGSHCDERYSVENATTRAHLTGYDRAWRKLSSRVRALRPWCSVCLTTVDLTADQSPQV